MHVFLPVFPSLSYLLFGRPPSFESSLASELFLPSEGWLDSVKKNRKDRISANLYLHLSQIAYYVKIYSLKENEESFIVKLGKNCLQPEPNFIISGFSLIFISVKTTSNLSNVNLSKISLLVSYTLHLGSMSKTIINY